MSKYFFYFKIYRKIYYLPFYLIFKFFYTAYSSFKRELIIRRFDIDQSVKFWHNTYFTGIGKISVGKGTYFGQQTFIVSNPKEAVIQIGEHCMISHDVHIRTETYDSMYLEYSKRKKKHGNIIIGKNVFIGKGVYIKGGITIGDNVTIGANSVVTKNVSSNMVVGGSPATIIKTNA
jgi:maltose O-acetyltransferase